MSSRTTATAVKAIMDTDVTEDQITASGILDDANNFVNVYLGDQSLDDNLLSSIEKWVVAHMISVGLDAQYSQETAKGVGGTRSGQYGMNLQMTSYGQTACSLDPTGILAGVGGRLVQVIAVKGRRHGSHRGR